jgi:CheY-like chemotaxis protein
MGTVLVVDDSEIARTTLKNALTMAGMKVIDLPSPIGATRAIMNNDVSVVVIDLMMPGMRGDRLTTLFRENPRFQTLGVVLVSGENEAEMLRLADEVGADAAVSKSNMTELVSAVRRAYLKRAAYA